MLARLATRTPLARKSGSPALPPRASACLRVCGRFCVLCLTHNVTAALSPSGTMLVPHLTVAQLVFRSVRPGLEWGFSLGSLGAPPRSLWRDTQRSETRRVFPGDSHRARDVVSCRGAQSVLVPFPVKRR